MSKIKLGDKVRDAVTKYEGICTAIIKYLNGCRRIGIQGEGKDQNNLPVDLYYIDETTVEIVEKEVHKTEQDEKGASNFSTPKFKGPQF